MRKMERMKAAVILASALIFLSVFIGCEDSSHADRLSALDKVEAELSTESKTVTDSDVAKIVQDLITANNKLDSITDAMADVKTTLNLTDNDIVKIVKALKEDDTKLRQFVSDAKDKLNLEDESIDDLITKINEEIETLQNTVENLENILGISSDEEITASIKAKVVYDEETGKASISDTAIDEITANLKTKLNISSENESYLKKLVVLIGEKVCDEVENAALRTTIENLNKIIEENTAAIEALNKETEQLNQTIDSNNNTISELTTAKDNLTSENEELTSTLETTKDTLKSTEETLETTKETLETTKESLEATEKALTAAENTIAEKEKQIEDNNTEIEELEAAKETLQKQYDELKSADETLQSQYDELQAAYETLKTENEDLKKQIEELQSENQQLRTVYVNPLQLDVNNVGALAVTSTTSSTNSTARFAEDIADEDINLVIVKEDGTVESAIAIGTEKNAQITEVPEETHAEETEGEEVEEVTPTAIYKYVSEENNSVGKVIETIQCPYEVNDVEAKGYYLVFNKVSSFTYDDGTEVLTGPLIYVTPDGEERDVLKDGGFNLENMVTYGTNAEGNNNPLTIYSKSQYGSPYIVFDENGDAFFAVWNGYGKKSIYRYQPIAKKLENLTPGDLEKELTIGSFEVSLDGKFVVYSDDTGVKALKVADKTVKQIYTFAEGVKTVSVSNIIYMDKNHSFYFTTYSYNEDSGKEKYVVRWNYENYETVVIDKKDYSDSELINNDLWSFQIDPNPAGGAGDLLLTDEGIFVMAPADWDGTLQKHLGSVLVKFVNSDGDFIPCEIPESEKDTTGANVHKSTPPLYDADKSGVKDADPSTWLTKGYLSNGKGIVLICDSANSSDAKSLYYYRDGRFLDLLGKEYPEYTSIDKLSLSDTSVIFTGVAGGNTYTKSIDIEDGLITDISINGTVVNMMAVKGASIKKSDASDTVIKFGISVKDPDDLIYSSSIDEGVLTITAATGYDKYIFSCNEVVLNSINTNELVKDVKTWAKGYYPIYIEAVKNGLPYTAFVEVEIK